MAQNVVLDADMAYVEDGHLVLIIPIPKEGYGWVPDKSESVERVTVIHAANGELGFRDMLVAGTVNPIKGLDDETAKVVVKLTCDPIFARDELGQQIVIPERGQRAATRSARRGIPLDELTTKAVDKSRAAGPVTTRRMSTREKVVVPKK